MNKHIEEICKKSKIIIKDTIDDYIEYIIFDDLNNIYIKITFNINDKSYYNYFYYGNIDDISWDILFIIFKNKNNVYDNYNVEIFDNYINVTINNIMYGKKTLHKIILYELKSI